MNRWSFILSVFFVTVTGQDDKWFVFSNDQASLSKCIEDYILNTDSSFKQEGIAKVVSDLVAKKFFKKSLTGKDFDTGINYGIYKKEDLICSVVNKIF